MSIQTFKKKVRFVMAQMFPLNHREVFGYPKDLLVKELWHIR